MSAVSQCGPLPNSCFQQLSGLSLDLVGERRPSFSCHAVQGFIGLPVVEMLQGIAVIDLGRKV